MRHSYFPYFYARSIFMQEKKFSVIQVIDQLEVGGAERVLLNWANTLQQKGHISAIVVTVNPGRLYKNINAGVQVFDLHRKWKWNPGPMKRLAKILKNYDIIHIHSAHNLRYTWLATKLFGLHKPLFFHEHFYYEKIAWHQRWIYPRTKMICPAGKTRQWAIQHKLTKAENSFVLPNTILLQQTNTFATYKENNSVQLLQVSNIYGLKNLEFAIEFLHALHQREVGKYELTIIGKIVDPEYFQAIQIKIKELQLQAYVQFKHDCDEVQPLLGSYDFALHTSTQETGPMVLIEYLAHGLPFLTFDIGEVPQQVKPVLPGMVLNNFELNNWLRAFYQLQASDKTKLRTQMQALFEKQFSMETYYTTCMQIYAAGLTALH